MKVYVLIISDRDMRPRSDIVTAIVFANLEDALVAMENAIAEAIETEQIDESEIERHDDLNYVVSVDDRFAWKIEERIVH